MSRTLRTCAASFSVASSGRAYTRAQSTRRPPCDKRLITAILVTGITLACGSHSRHGSALAVLRTGDSEQRGATVSVSVGDCTGVGERLEFKHVDYLGHQDDLSVAPAMRLRGGGGTFPAKMQVGTVSVYACM